MKTYKSKIILLIAAFCMVMVNTVSVYAAANSTQPNTRKIERCVRAVVSKAKSLGKNLPPIISEAAIRTCWITEDRRAAYAVLTSLSLDAIKKAADRAGKIQIQQGFNGKARTKEPGLLGLDGAREVLTNVLATEAVGLWYLADAIGGPKIPEEKPASISGETTSANGMVIHYQTSNGSNENNTYVDQYVKAHLQALEGNPDSALALKARMFQILKKISLTSVGKRTADEKRLVASFESYVRDQYVRMIDIAVKKQKDFEGEQNKKDNQSLAGAYTGGFGAAPPDLFDHMGGALVLSTYGAALASMIAGASSFAATGAASVSAAAAAAAAAATTAGPAAAAAAVSSATSTAATAASLSGGGIISGGAAVIAGPVAVVTGSILVAVLATKALVQNIKIDKRLGELTAWKKNGRIDAKVLLGTREGTMQFQHFYAKATSSSSPGEYVSPAEGCQACFYADKDFGGPVACTAARVGDLGAAKVNGAAINLNNRVSSVSIDQSNCQNSFAVVYDSKNLKGNRQVIRSNVADLSVFSRTKIKNWNNAASSAVFSNDNAPKCEVCTYSKAGYTGAKFCTTGGVNALSGVGMANKITSVELNTKDCSKAKAWLYKKTDFARKANGSGSTEITASINDLGQGVRNTSSSIYFSADGTNPYEQAASGGCRACLYDHAGSKGEYMCVTSNIPDMGKYRVAGEAFNFKNKATSIQFIYDNCKKNETLELEMFSKVNYKGTVRRYLGRDVASLTGGANNSAASVKLHHADKTKACRVCLYKDANYQGEKQCTSGAINKLADGLNNSVSSIRVEKGTCSGGGVAIYGNKAYGGKSLFVFGNIPDLKSKSKSGGGNWNNHLTSIKFSPKMAEAKAEAEKLISQALIPVKVDPATLCKVCLYKDKNYGGASQCVTGKTSALNSPLPNSVSSIKVFRGACKDGGAIVYSQKNYGGKSAFVMNSDSDLADVRGSKNNWNNTIASIKFSKNLRSDLVSIYKAQIPGGSEKSARALIDKTFGE